MFLNFILALQVTFEHLSTSELVMGQGIDFNNQCKAQLGSYVEAHEDIVVNSTQHPRTYPGTYLGPTGNIQVTMKVFYLKTSAINKPRIMIEFPIPYRLIIW